LLYAASVSVLEREKDRRRNCLFDLLPTGDLDDHVLVALFTTRVVSFKAQRHVQNVRMLR
jgi:hypothetical protein